MPDRTDQILNLVEDLRQGRPDAAERLLPLVYDDLRVLAASLLRHDRPSHTLQPTALVNEACLKLMGGKPRTWDGREHFLAVAAMAMRQVLVSHARARHAVKRGGAGQRERLTIADPVDPRPPADLDILALEEVLAQLEREDPPLARIIELRYFAGMSIEQVALVLGLSERTVNRQWRLARAELAAKLAGPEQAP